MVAAKPQHNRVFQIKKSAIALLCILMLASVPRTAANNDVPKVEHNELAAASCCEGIRGNVNGDPLDQIDIADIVYLVRYMFVDSPPPPCLDEANVAGDPFGEIDIVDLTYLVDYAWRYGPMPPVCGASRHPAPQTAITKRLSPSSLPFIDGPEGSVLGGAKFGWIGSHPTLPGIPLEYEYEWRLYGPYTKDEIGAVNTTSMRNVWVTHRGDILELGDSITYCDSFTVGGVIVDTCYSVTYPSTNQTTAYYGQEEKLFDVASAFFDVSPLNRIAKSSSITGSAWSDQVAVELFDLYGNSSFDTTVQMSFIFWVRARQPQLGIDPVPAHATFEAIDPHFERDVLVMDFTLTLGLPTTTRYTSRNAAKAYWYNALSKWKPGIDFDTTVILSGELRDQSKDYFSTILGTPILNQILKHKVVICYNEGLQSSGIQLSLGSPVYRAMNAGVNVWLTMRAPIVGNLGQSFISFYPPTEYTTYFGVDQMVFSGWFCHALEECTSPPQRIEDFIGAVPANSAAWPSVYVDTTLLKTRLRWGGNTLIPYQVPALPEVDWSTPGVGTEVLYTYKSLYGSTHPLGVDYSFEGLPVALRTQRPDYRSVHFNFTPMVMDSVSMQIVIDSVLNWLYDPTLSAPVRPDRYIDDKSKILRD